MNYSLHPEALGDLRDAASFYREKAGTSLSRSFIGEFRQLINILLLQVALGFARRLGFLDKDSVGVSELHVDQRVR
jgi:hypothetical protein